MDICKRNRKVGTGHVRDVCICTYAAIYAYLPLAAFVTVRLMRAGRYEVAIGVLGGVAGLAGSTSGFWFGARKPAQQPE